MCPSFNSGSPSELPPDALAAEEIAAAERARLEITWSRQPGFIGWVTSTNHKDIGLRFIITAMINFLLAGVLALLMRIQLAQPENSFLGPDLYNELFTTHGTAMMFLFAVPVMEGMGLYLVPLMVGTRNVSFPKLLNFGYYVYLIASLILFTGLFLNIGPDMGWFSYVPLAGPQFSPGKRVDLWSQMVTLVEVSSLVGAIEIITTVFKQRAPGMSLARIPLFVWAQVVTSFMILFAMPAVMLCSTMLATDRLSYVNTHFYNPAEGGDALLWQHLFWFFAHPEVYIIFLPATGFISTIIPTFARRPQFGYTALVLAAVAVAFIGFGVWVHHMFVTPLPELGQGLFTASSLMITIPNGIQIFCWLATLASGSLVLRTPLGFVLGFFAVFLIGGLTGVMLASLSIDQQVHDTYFVVAHLHYVLIGGALFPLFGAFYYWFPKWTGRMLNEKLGWLNLALMFIGFNLTFFPMHRLGLVGMPRRIYTYLPATGWGERNFLATIGAGTLGVGILVFLINVLWSRKRGLVAGPDPWNAGTLEWATTSPPPSYNFHHPRTVGSAYPLWDDPATMPVVTGLSLDHREVLVTTSHDAMPDHRYHMASDSLIPLLMAIGVGGTIVGLIFHPLAFPIGFVLVLLLLAAWCWPTREPMPLKDPNRLRSSAAGVAPRPRETIMTTPQIIDVSDLPGTGFDTRLPSWWGNTLMMAIETMTVALLLVSYFYLAQNFQEWPPPNVDRNPPIHEPLPELPAGTTNALLMLVSLAPMIWADRAARKLEFIPTVAGLGISAAIGIGAIVLRGFEFASLRVRWDENAYGSLVWAILFLHLTYLILVTAETGAVALWTLTQGIDENHAVDATLAAAYWYWTVAVGIVLYGIVYWAPRIM